MNQRVIRTPSDLIPYIGQELGVGAWIEVTQERVTRFADVTDDRNYLHVDPDRAKATRFGGTIAHGLLTLSLVPLLARSRRGIRFAFDSGLTVSFGLNRVRFVAPVPIGARIRLRTRLLDVEEIDPDVFQLIQQQTVELEGETRPALVAETLLRIYP